MDAVLEKRVEAEVRAEPRPIIREDKVKVVAMLDVHVPAHEAHLEAKDRQIMAVIQKNEFRSVAICDPGEALAEAHVLAFVDCIITRECFA